MRPDGVQRRKRWVLRRGARERAPAYGGRRNTIREGQPWSVLGHFQSARRSHCPVLYPRNRLELCAGSVRRGRRVEFDVWEAGISIRLLHVEHFTKNGS